MKRRAFGAALTVGCLLALGIACGDEEQNHRSMRPSRSLPQDSGDATGNTNDGGSSPDGETPDNTSDLPSKPSQLNWDGAQAQGDANFNVYPTE